MKELFTEWVEGLGGIVYGLSREEIPGADPACCDCGETFRLTATMSGTRAVAHVLSAGIFIRGPTSEIRVPSDLVVGMRYYDECDDAPWGPVDAHVSLKEWLTENGEPVEGVWVANTEEPGSGGPCIVQRRRTFVIAKRVPLIRAEFILLE